MKILISCVTLLALFSCTHHSSLSETYGTHSTSKAAWLNHSTASHCPTTVLDLSDRLCNLQQWQRFAEQLMNKEGEALQQLKITLADTFVDTIKATIIDLHPSQAMSIRKAGIENL
ncbi:MAG: hypothetical protein AAFZ92_09940 [Pseudomonadota bacterium]